MSFLAYRTPPVFAAAVTADSAERRTSTMQRQPARGLTRVLLLMLALAGVGAPARGAEPDLSLVARVDGRETTDIRIRGDHVVPYIDGAPVRESSNTVWSLRGDVLADIGLGRFSPLYTVRRKAPPPGVTGSGDSIAEVIWYLDRSVWPLSQLNRDGAIVGAWIVDGRPVHVRVLYVPVPTGTMRSMERHADSGGILFSLSEDDARGFPLLLLWDRGRWLRPVAYSHNTEFQAAAAAIYREDAVAFRDALARIKDPDARPGNADATLLHLAAESGRLFAVDALLERGASVDVAIDWSKTDHFTRGARILSDSPLDWAVGAGRASVAARLLEHGALRDSSAPLFDPLFRRALDAGWTGIARDLLAARPEYRLRDRHLDAWLQATLHWGDVPLLEQWVEERGRSSLADVEPAVVVRAAASSDPGALSVLLRGGASPDSATDQSAALISAASLNRADAIRLLVGAGAHIDAAAPDGTTPLHAAIRSGHADAVKTLLALGADPNAARPSEPTALHFAVGLARADLAGLLLEAGARIDATDTEGRTPLDVALHLGATGVLDSLIQHGARLETKSVRFPSSLTRSLELDTLPLITHAIDDGWDPNLPLDASWLPWQIAQFSGAHTTGDWLRPRTTVAATHSAFRISELDVPPRMLAMSLGREARLFHPPLLAKGVAVDGVVTEEGSLVFARVRRSPNPVLTKHVVDAIPAWRFAPGRRQGRPVAVITRIEVTFSPDRKKAAGPSAASVVFVDVPSD